MVKSSKPSRTMPATDRSSVSATYSANYMDNTYCVVLHVVEAINFYGREVREGEREQIIMNAALNTVDFEVEGTPSSTTETIIFNSNCIWECDLAGVKRIKTDHRPVKVTFFSCCNSERKTIGTLLLPVRGLPVMGTGGNNNPLQLKMFWHKLACISNEFRSHKPEVLLMLAIIKKTLLHTKEFKHLTALNRSEKQSRTPPLQSPGHSITANMLQSQANVYVQSLVQLGLLQVGNDPLVDCDIIEVVLQFKQLKNVNKFVQSLQQGKGEVETVLLMFDFVGNVTNIDLKLNSTDLYTLNDVLGLRFKSSLRSIRLYFQRIFYLPINMYVNGSSIANYRMDFGKLLPPDSFFADNRKFVHEDSFAFDRFGRMGSARELKPIMDYTFTVEIQEVCWRQQEMLSNMQAEQPQQPEVEVDIQSVASKAVILEAPKERAQESLVEWNHNSEQQSTSSKGSACSLNVGAELSASDDEAESALGDAPESDLSSIVHTSQGRRRKFTRLVASNPEMVNEEEDNGEPQYLNNIVTRKLSSSLDFEEGQLADDDLLDNVSENDTSVHKNSHAQKPNDWLPQRMHDSIDLINRRSSGSVTSSLEKEELKAGRSKMKVANAKQGMLPRRSQKKTFPDEKNTEIFEEVMEINATLAEESEQKCGKRHSRRSLKMMLDDDLNRESELTLTSQSLQSIPHPSTDAYDREAKHSRSGMSNRSNQQHNIPTHEKALNSKELNKKKLVSNVQDFELEETHAQKSYRKSNINLNQSETDEQEEFIHKPKAARVKPKAAMKGEDYPIDPTISNRKLKSKPCARPATDLSLSARWVDVSKHQTKVLRETEQFISDSCNINMDGSAAEEQLSDASKMFKMQKLLERSSRSRKSAEPIGDSTLIGESYHERKPLKKKCSALDFEQNSIVNITSAESSLTEHRKVALKVKKIKESSQDQPLDLEQTKLVQLNIRQKEQFHEEVESSVSEVLSSRTRGHERRSKRSSHKTSLQKYLDAEEAALAEVALSLAEKVQRNNPIELEVEETEISELEPTQRKKSNKNRTNIAPSSASELVNKLCSSKQKKSDANEQISRLEVTVHMYDETKAAADEAAKSSSTKYANQSVNTDITNMDKSIKRILATGRCLQEEMQRKSQEFETVSQQNSARTARLSSDSQEMPHVEYESKFSELEEHIAVLEQHLRKFERRSQEMQEMNAKLADEKLQLKERITNMEQQIAQLGMQGAKSKDLQRVLSEMRTQNLRYMEMSMAKDRYKKQWRRSAKRVHALKLAIYEKKLDMERTTPANVINLKNILTQDAVEFEREYGRFRRTDTELNFSGSNESPEPLLKDYLRGLSTQAVHQHKPADHVDSTRMH